MWPSIRKFLNVPDHLTGKNTAIAVIDVIFPHHPDISSNNRRNVYHVNTSEPKAEPLRLTANKGPWNTGLHGLWTASAAGGSGQLSGGNYSGAAPEAELFLIEAGLYINTDDMEVKFCEALNWLKKNYRKFNIRGTVLTISALRDSGLLPWQADPIRVLCEELTHEGLLVISASGNTIELTCNGPASSPSVLSVGGLIVPKDGMIKHTKPYHGCRGVTFEGKGVPEILAPAENVVLPMPFQSEEERMSHATAPFDVLPKEYARNEGTSFAGPIILGAAACIWQAHPEWSAHQVKTAILESSFHYPAWQELQAGLIDVSAAVDYEPSHAEDQLGSPFSHWQSWKRKIPADRLEALRSQHEETIVRVLLSFLFETISEQYALPIQDLLVHPSWRIRTATVALLASHPAAVRKDDLRKLLTDDSRYVKMGALYTLGNCADLWEPLSGDLISLFSDPDSDIKFCALKIASKIKNRRFIEPLISGLEHDARNQNVAAFGARVIALKAITGIHFPETGWREGDCPYSDRTTDVRLSICQKWQEWKKS
ncbi:S8 family serine peptidase [Paenibacillus sp. sptzw28]|uniref:S8 family serine peptidase n=1 Tax=Paenibacillus sp. sptzw28 TaxID=715179 RepID=UPI001C6F5D89|nr:S8 family serine peptidase [Paenibacillus sp. sptzw28]QYR22411.1 S8 family serine peptidase [Paenibacillus sp. sptzw28]